MERGRWRKDKQKRRGKKHGKEDKERKVGVRKSRKEEEEEEKKKKIDWGGVGKKNQKSEEKNRGQEGELKIKEEEVENKERRKWKETVRMKKIKRED